MEILNCLGDFCPVPLLNAVEAARKLAPGESFMLVTDHSCVLESLREHFISRRYDLSIEEVLNGVWEVTISKKC